MKKNWLILLSIVSVIAAQQQELPPTQQEDDNYEAPNISRGATEAPQQRRRQYPERNYARSGYDPGSDFRYDPYPPQQGENNNDYPARNRVRKLNCLYLRIFSFFLSFFLIFFPSFFPLLSSRFLLISILAFLIIATFLLGPFSADSTFSFLHVVVLLVSLTWCCILSSLILRSLFLSLFIFFFFFGLLVSFFSFSLSVNITL